MSDKKQKNRRDFIFTATATAGAVGVGAAVWPLVDQMNPDASVKALASTEVDISSVKPGQSITVVWRGKPVFIKRRTQEEIDKARSVSLDELKHPEKDEDRVKNAEWLVMLGICTHLGCVPLSDNGTHPRCVQMPNITNHSGFLTLSSSFSGCFNSSNDTDLALSISS